ncbi:MAG: hypothetical protein KatS3mg105_2749 [Gemmatales bacterium]|nr:MAG: hypothetical protein KatS3mg105_2749 [Gemmatales bacterium]
MSSVSCCSSGFLAVFGAVYYQHRDNVGALIDGIRNDPDMREQYMPLILIVGFFLGLFAQKVGNLLGKDGPPWWFQDIQASVALLAALVMVGLILVKLVINPSRMANDEDIYELPALEQFLAAFAGYYFGARS